MVLSNLGFSDHECLSVTIKTKGFSVSEPLSVTITKKDLFERATPDVFLFKLNSPERKVNPIFEELCSWYWFRENDVRFNRSNKFCSKAKPRPKKTGKRRRSAKIKIKYHGIHLSVEGWSGPSTHGRYVPAPPSISILFLWKIFSLDYKFL